MDNRIFVYRQGPSRLLDFLAQSLEVSKKKAKQFLDQRSVFVNDDRVWIASYELKHGDRVSVQVAEEKAGTGQVREKDPIDVIYKDRYLIVVNKPAGITTNGPRSLETVLKKQLGDRSIMAVHRLDSQTSGAIIFARGADVKQAFVDVFKSNKVSKSYRLVVSGRYDAKLKNIALPVDGKPALTVLNKIIAASFRVSYLEVSIPTGRKHQIRIHMAASGFPVVGDTRYFTKKVKNPQFKYVPRQLLHSYRIKFPHPVEDKMVVVTAKMPADFKKSLDQLGLGGFKDL